MNGANFPTGPPTVAPPGWYPDAARTGWIWWDGQRYLQPAPTSGSVPDGTGSTPAATGWFPAVPTLPLPAALLGIGFMAVITIMSRLVELLPDTSAAIASLGLLLPSTLGLPLVAWYGSRRWGTRRFVHDLGMRFRAIDVPIGVATAIALTVLIVLVSALFLILGAPKGSNLSEVAENGRNVALFAVLFVMAGIIAPITEEIMFRGLIMRGLSSQLGGWWAVVTQGAIFGAAHITPGEGWGNLSLIVGLGALGMGLGFVTRLTGRLGPAIVAHALFNCSQLGLLWLSLGT